MGGDSKISAQLGYSYLGWLRSCSLAGHLLGTASLQALVSAYDLALESLSIECERLIASH